VAGRQKHLFVFDAFDDVVVVQFCALARHQIAILIAEEDNRISVIDDSPEYLEWQRGAFGATGDGGGGGMYQLRAASRSIGRRRAPQDQTYGVGQL